MSHFRKAARSSPRWIGRGEPPILACFIRYLNGLFGGFAIELRAA
jgi:hypothetical protein